MIQLGDLIVGEHFTFEGSVYQVKRIDRLGKTWPASRWFHVGSPGDPREQRELPHDTLVTPKLTTRV